MNCREIIEKYLIDNGYDGLFHEGECGCELSDLMPCDGEFIEICEPGYKTVPEEDDVFEFYIGPERAKL